MTYEYEIVESIDQHDWNNVVDACFRTEHWNFAYSDFDVWKRAFGADVGFIAAKGKDGVIMAHVNWCRFAHPEKEHEKVGAIAMYYVPEEYRGNGIGPAVFDRAARILNETTCGWGLNGVHTMYDKYRKSVYGLQTETNWHKECYIVKDANVDRLDVHEKGEFVVKSPATDETLLKETLKYYRDATGCNVDCYLKAWLAHQNGHSLIAVDEENKIIGCVQARYAAPNQKTIVVGPLVADSPMVASHLLRELLPKFNDYNSYEILFVSGSNEPALCGLLETLAAKPVVSIGWSGPLTNQSTIPTIQKEKHFVAFEYAFSPC